MSFIKLSIFFNKKWHLLLKIKNINVKRTKYSLLLT